MRPNIEISVDENTHAKLEELAKQQQRTVAVIASEYVAAAVGADPNAEARAAALQLREALAGFNPGPIVAIAQALETFCKVVR